MRSERDCATAYVAAVVPGRVVRLTCRVPFCLRPPPVLKMLPLTFSSYAHEPAPIRRRYRLA
jgi:hypothetical protein